jgi:putative MATE family efflux protein
MADSETAPPAAASPRGPGGGRDLTTGPINRTLLTFALPTLGANVLQSLNGSVNAIWIGQILGPEALAATSNATLVMFLMYAALFGFGMAATILIGQAYGRKDIESVRRTVGSAAGLFVTLAVIIAVIGYAEADRLLALLSTPPEARPLASKYLSVVFLSMPPAFVLTLLGMSLRGTGNSMTPLIWSLVNVALDIILNPFLMRGIGPIPAMGIAGSAVATLLATGIALGGMLIHIYARDMVIRLRGAEWRFLKPDWSLLKIILVKGIPMTVQMFVLSGAGLVMLGLINREGWVTVAAYGITQQLWNYITMPAMAVGGAVSAMAAQNIGAGKWDRVSRITRSGVITSVLLTTSLVVIFTLLDRQFYALFVAPDSPVMAVAVHINWLSTWSLVLFGITFTLFGVVRANGAVWPPLIMLVLSLIPFRIGTALVFRPVIGADAIWYSFGASSAVTVILAVLYYRYGGWRSARMGPAPAPARQAEPLQVAA